MRIKSILAALLLMVAALQIAWGQSFRVYQSDGTELQFSMETDSIVFYDGIGPDQKFGPFTPVNQMIAGTWYWSKTGTVSFNEDGTTDLEEGTTYEFMPYQGTIVLSNPAGRPTSIYNVQKLTKEMMVLTGLDALGFLVLTRTMPPQYVYSIELSQTLLTLHVDESKRLTATVEPDDADNPTVKWESSDNSVAEVNSSGRVTGNGLGTCVITCSATDGSGVKAECQVKVRKPDTMESVDLGLPSGTLWATCNVGATAPEEFGDYFAWGETEPKSYYFWRGYKYCTGAYDYATISCKSLTKYCDNSSYGADGFTDNLTVLLPEDDAATANWGNEWQMPSQEQVDELLNETTAMFTTQNDVSGVLFTSKSNNQSIFLPAAGCYYYDHLYNEGDGIYWCRTLCPGYPDSGGVLYFFSDEVYRTGSDRCWGNSVRPVRKK